MSKPHAYLATKLFMVGTS